MKSLRFSFLAFLFIIATHSVSAQSSSFVPKVEVTKIQDGLYILGIYDDPNSSVVNSILSIGDDGILIVDHAGEWRDMTVSEEVGDLVSQKIAELSGDKGTPNYIINTHWHGDHIGANLLWGSGADIIAHDNVYMRLSEPQNPFWSEVTLGPIAESGWPNITFSDSLNLYLNGSTIQLLNFGIAHTDGDAMVYFKNEGLVHMGDLYHGHTNPTAGADAVGLRNTYTSILSRIPTKDRATVQFVTGHAGLTSYDELATHAKLYTEVIDFVEKKLTEKVSEEKILQDGLPSPWNTTWDVSDDTKAGFLRFVLSSILLREGY